MKYLTILLVLLAGCMTKYEVTKKVPRPDGTVEEVRVVVNSFREFEQPEIHYHRDGASVTFDFGAESAKTAVSPVEGAIAKGIETGALILTPTKDE
jgi:hypothetical protein